MSTFSFRQADILRAPQLHADTPVNKKRCAKCACNPGSSERDDPYGWIFLTDGWRDCGIPFYCHESVPGHYQEATDDRPRWRLCAGWHSVVGSIQNAMNTSGALAQADIVRAGKT